MKHFFAGSEAGKFRDILLECKAKNVLMSFYWIKKGSDLEELSKDFDIFLDSGGYSARKQGVDIDVEKYGEFLKDYGKYL